MVGRSVLLLGVILAVVGLGFVLPARQLSAMSSVAGGSGSFLASQKLGVRARYAQLPISFEVNRGQVNHQVAFQAHTSGITLFLTPGRLFCH